MLNPDRVYMLAADHRWQWEEWCDARSIPRDRIGDAKRIAYDGFLEARRQSAAVRQFGAMLLDAQYASPVIADAARDGIEVGTPAEKPGAFPLAWATDPFDRALIGTFVKVLVRHRADLDESVREAQFAMLTTLAAWCADQRKPLIIEILVARTAEPEREFDATGRPMIIASLIRDWSARGLVPAFWKIEGTADRDGARIIDAAIAERPAGRQIILGKAADMATIGRWFTAAADSRTAVGFAIGRSVFWEPCEAYLAGTATAGEAAELISLNYLTLIDAWHTAQLGQHQ